jgi:hypothetical protein
VLIALAVISIGYLLYEGKRSSNLVSHDIAQAIGTEATVTEVKMLMPRTLREGLYQQTAKVLADGLSAAQRSRPQDLHEVDFDRVEIPDDYSAYVEMLDPLANAPQFVPALAAQIRKLGRPVMVAAVARLQELNYAGVRECQTAVNLQLLLADMTGLKSLVVKVKEVQPSMREVCMFHAVADGWRVIVERYAATDRQYGELLAVSRSVGFPAAATSPR